MKAAGLAVLLCIVGLECASAAPLELAPGSWEFTTLLRNFSISADGQHEIENGGSGPDTERACVTKHAFESGSLYPGLKNPTVAAHCKVTTISETSNLIDSVVECSAHDGASPQIDHTVVTAPTSKSFTTVHETTFIEPNYDGSISRSTLYRRGRWLKDSCDK
jgi:hypothetical protein